MPQVLELCGIVKIIWGKAHGFRIMITRESRCGLMVESFIVLTAVKEVHRATWLSLKVI